MDFQAHLRNTRTLKAAIFVCLLFFVSIAQASIVWNWSFGSEGGTFTTTGTSADLTGPSDLTITGFQVTSSSIPGNIGAVYTWNQPDQGVLWDGSKITQFYRSSGTYTNGSNFFNDNGLYSYTLYVETNVIQGELNDSSEATVTSGTTAVTPAPAQAVGLPTLSQYGQLLATALLLLTGLIVLHRKTA